MIQNHKTKNNTNGDIDLPGVIIALILLGGFYLLVMYPQMRGPTADMEVTAVIEPNGVLSQYEVTLQFVDGMSYSQFLSYINSQKIASINDYELRMLWPSEAFSIVNDSTNRRIKIDAKQPFDPNNATTNIRIRKNLESWEYEDVSIINSSHLPEKYINKLTYTLTIPSEIIYANTPYNSSNWWSDNKQITWNINRDKNPLNPSGDSIASPTIYTKFKTPDQNKIPKIVIIGIGIIILLGIIFYAIRR